MERSFDTFSEDPCGKLEVTEVWVTPQQNLVISYTYTQEGKELSRMVAPEFINLPMRPSDSSWD